MKLRTFLAAPLAAAGLLAAALWPAPAAASTYTTLHSFCGSASCTDGRVPQSPVLKHGHFLYGVADGGAHNHGMVFRYNLNTGAFTDLYDMCSMTAPLTGNCKDGDSPIGNLVIDASGNLYGVTQLGGALSNGGMVYELVKPATGSIWTFQTLHTFCAACGDGLDPLAGLAYSGQSSGSDYNGTALLFGTTLSGGYGTPQGFGTVYALQNSSGSWSEKILHLFCNGCSTCTNCGDGIEPVGSLYMDASDRLWGVTLVGGSNDNGMAFELTHGADEWNDPWAETVLYNFCWNGASKCTDGALPNGVVLDASGNVWGTTNIGGSGSGATGSGTVFELTNSSCTEGGTATFWCDTVRHSFCVSTCSDGQHPPVNSNLVIDGSGILYGTAIDGGSNSKGTIFQQSGATYTKLHDFCAAASCADGANPFAGVTLDGSGNLYGTTISGGANNAGVAYEFTP